MPDTEVTELAQAMADARNGDDCAVDKKLALITKMASTRGARATKQIVDAINSEQTKR